MQKTLDQNEIKGLVSSYFQFCAENHGFFCCLLLGEYKENQEARQGWRYNFETLAGPYYSEGCYEGARLTPATLLAALTEALDIPGWSCHNRTNAEGGLQIHIYSEDKPDPTAPALKLAFKHADSQPYLATHVEGEKRLEAFQAPVFFSEICEALEAAGDDWNAFQLNPSSNPSLNR